MTEAFSPATMLPTTPGHLPMEPVPRLARRSSPRPHFLHRLRHVSSFDRRNASRPYRHPASLVRRSNSLVDCICVSYAVIEAVAHDLLPRRLSGRTPLVSATFPNVATSCRHARARITRQNPPTRLVHMSFKYHPSKVGIQSGHPKWASKVGIQSGTCRLISVIGRDDHGPWLEWHGRLARTDWDGRPVSPQASGS